MAWEKEGRWGIIDAKERQELPPQGCRLRFTFFTGVAGCDEDGRLLGLFFSAVEALEFVHSGTHVGEEQIEDRDCGHGFYDYDGAWDDDRVVTSFDDHFGVFSIFGDGGLWL